MLPLFVFMIDALDRFTDVLGEPLRDHQRGCLAAFAADPRPSTWEDAHGIVLNVHGMTLWQAWLAVDSTAPTTGRHVTIDPWDRLIVLEEWSRIPDAAMLERLVAFVLAETPAS